MKSSFIGKILITVLAMGLVSCSNVDAKQRIYIMCIRHHSKDIALTCLNTYGTFLSQLSPDQMLKTNEFENPSVFGSRGTTDTEEVYMPQVNNRIQYVTNEVELSSGESITDFNGFTIKAEEDAFVVSNGKRKVLISEKQDWLEITSNGFFEYGGQCGSRPVEGWQEFLWCLGFRKSMLEYKPAKECRYWKWCISPVKDNPNEFEVYTVYIPKNEVVWQRRKIWYSSLGEKKNE